MNQNTQYKQILIDAELEWMYILNKRSRHFFCSGCKSIPSCSIDTSVKWTAPWWCFASRPIGRLERQLLSRTYPPKQSSKPPLMSNVKPLVKCLARRHIDKWTRGARNWPTDPLIGLQPALPPTHATRGEKQLFNSCLMLKLLPRSVPTSEAPQLALNLPFASLSNNNRLFWGNWFYSWPEETLQWKRIAKRSGVIGRIPAFLGYLLLPFAYLLIWVLASQVKVFALSSLIPSSVCSFS